MFVVCIFVYCNKVNNPQEPYSYVYVYTLGKKHIENKGSMQIVKLYVMEHKLHWQYLSWVRFQGTITHTQHAQ